MKYFSKISLYWHTLRYLKPIQFYGRAWFIYYKPRLKCLKMMKARDNSYGWISPICKPVSLIAPNCFRFLNYTHTLPEQGGWHNEALEKLWIYNLHYFDDLNAIEASSRNDWHRRLMHRWVLENPPYQGIGWDSYPTSLRIVNWIKWALKGNQFPSHFLESLCKQTYWLEKRLEWHLLGNHLFANAKALVFAGLFFEGDNAQKWFQKGCYIIRKQILEQILKDGGHFERSPMYHAIFLEDILDLINIMQTWKRGEEKPFLEMLKSYVPSMLDWLKGMVHPDKEISFFNDAAFGIAPRLDDLIQYALRLDIYYKSSEDISYPSSTDKISINYFKESGYIRLSSAAAVCILDTAPIGPDYLPGHSHADTLSFELSVHQKRFIVNGGTSCYGNGIQRLKERQTSNHNTVEVNNQNSSEVWGGFRVARRAYPFNLKIDKNPYLLRISCAHNGYQSMPGKPTHHRVWEMEENSLKVYDKVNTNLPAVARYILHPHVHCLEINERMYALSLPSGETLYFACEVGEVHIEQSMYSPEFGKKFDTQALVVKLIQGRTISFFSWNKDAHSFLNR